MTFDVAFPKLLDERPAACLAVVLCYTEGLKERVAAKEIRVSPGLVNRRKLCGLGQLAAWTDRPAEEIALLLEDLGRAAPGPAEDDRQGLGVCVANGTACESTSVNALPSH